MINRILIAVPGIAVAVGAVWLGGWAFSIALAIVAGLAVTEYLGLLSAAHPVRWAAYAGVLVTVGLAATLDIPERGVLVGVGASVMLAAIGGLMLVERTEVAKRVALTAFGAVYIGVPVGLLIALRDLEFGAAAVANILIGTWAFDTFSYFGGRLLGRHPIAPRTSPKKTVEGFVVGVVGGTASVIVAGLWMDWIDWHESLVLGVVICAVAYVGDLFESLMKRDLGIKDSGRLLGEHGGVLDRFDALFFTSVAGFYATVWLVG